MIRHLFILLLTFNIYTQYATLNYPPNFQNSRIICSTTVTGGSVTFTTNFMSVFLGSPLIAIGISGMSLIPTIALDFRCQVPVITSTSFNIVIFLGATTTFSTINFQYLAIYPANYYNEGIYSPFYMEQKQFSGTQMLPLYVGYGDRFWQTNFARPNNLNQPNHNLICSAFITSVVATSIDQQYFLKNKCICLSTVSCRLRVEIKKNTQVTILRFRFFAADTFPIQRIRAVMVEFWQQKYYSGLTNDIVPTYTTAQAAFVYGISALHIEGPSTLGTSNFIFDLIYSGVSILPTNQIFTINYFFFTFTTNPSGSVGNTGHHLTFTGYNGCPFTTNQVLNIQKVPGNPGTLFIISKSNKLIVACSADNLEVYRHNGAVFVLIQKIYMVTACKVLKANDDLSVIIMTRWTSDLFFQVYTYNTTIQQYQFFQSYAAERAMQVYKLDITNNGKQIAASCMFAISEEFIAYFEFDLIKNKYVKLYEEQMRANVYGLEHIESNQVNEQAIFVIVLKSGNQIRFGRLNTTLGEFKIISSQFINQNQLKTRIQPINVSPLLVLSGNGKVMVIFTFNINGDITIFHYNQTTITFDKHSSFIPDMFSRNTPARLKIDYEGLSLAIYSKDSIGYYLVVYTRATLDDTFVLSAIQRTLAVASNSEIQITKEIVLITDITLPASPKFIIYYCGPSVLTSQVPVDGKLRILQNISRIQPISEMDLKVGLLKNDLIPIITKEQTDLNKLQQKNDAFMKAMIVIISIQTLILAIIIGLKIKNKYFNTSSQPIKPTQIVKFSETISVQNLRTGEQFLDEIEKNSSSINNFKSTIQEQKIQSNKELQQRVQIGRSNNSRKKRQKSIPNHMIESLQIINIVNDSIQ